MKRTFAGAWRLFPEMHTPGFLLANTLVLEVDIVRLKELYAKLSL
jgi:hypothetical protein